jgi:3-hydroxyisobutyrate dehydrogenase-like beta-hydroxyacid dehydrogenase
MGGNAVERLEEMGFDLIVFDSLAERMANHPSAVAAASVQDLAAQSDVILTFLPYSWQVEAVAIEAGGVIDGARPGTIFVNMGTISPMVTRRIAEVLAARAVDVIGAPMNGGPPVIRAGNLALVVGGKEDVVERCRPVLAALGDIRHMGDVGAGEAAKIVNNLILAICINANAEALVLGVKFGVDPEKLVDSVIAGVGANHGMSKHYKQHVLLGDFAEEGLFSVDFMRKDLALAFEMADELGVPLRLGALADQNYQAARAAGLAANYHPVVCTLLEDLCDVKIRSADAKEADSRQN